MRIWCTASTHCCYQISLVRYSTHDWHIAPPPFVLLMMSRKVLIDRVGWFHLDRPVLSFDITFFASLLHRMQPASTYLINGESLRTWSALVVMRIQHHRTIRGTNVAYLKTKTRHTILVGKTSTASSYTLSTVRFSSWFWEQVMTFVTYKYPIEIYQSTLQI